MSKSMRVLVFVLVAIRIPLVIFMCWLRVPLALLCNLISSLCLLLFLFSWFAFPEKTRMVVSFGAMSFFAFALVYVYDLLLAVLLPSDSMKRF